MGFPSSALVRVIVRHHLKWDNVSSKARCFSRDVRPSATPRAGEKSRRRSKAGECNGWLAGWLARTLGRKRSLAAVGVGRRRGPGGRGPRWRGRPRRRRVESRGSGVLDNAAGARHLVLMMIHRAVAFVRVAVAGTEEGSGGTACD